MHRQYQAFKPVLQKKKPKNGPFGPLYIYLRKISFMQILFKSFIYSKTSAPILSILLLLHIQKIYSKIFGL